MKYLLFSACVSALVASPALAAKCKDIEINIHNLENERMKVVQIRAYNENDDRWRTIRTANFDVSPASTGTYVRVTENVPGSRNERVGIRVKYKFVYGNDNTRYETDSSIKTCTTGQSYDASIPSSGHRPD